MYHTHSSMLQGIQAGVILFGHRYWSVFVYVWYKMTELEKHNGDLRRQLDKQQLHASKLADIDHDNPDTLSRDELARRYGKLNHYKNHGRPGVRNLS